MLKERALITLTLAPFALTVIYLGGWFYFVPATLILMIGVFEYSNMAERLGWKTAAWILAPTVFLLLFDSQFFGHRWQGLILFGGLFAAMCYALWLYESQEDTTAAGSWVTMSGGIILLGWLGSHFFRIRNLPANGWQWTMLAMTVIWSADSFAYLVGKQIGSRKLSPRLSPNKTVEGFVGGLIAGVLAALIVAGIVGLPGLTAALIGALIAIFAPLGDLAISLLKRTADIKDSGNMLPGHGGSLDRTDSLVWAVAIAYYYLSYFS